MNREGEPKPQCSWRLEVQVDPNHGRSGVAQMLATFSGRFPPNGLDAATRSSQNIGGISDCQRKKKTPRQR